MSDTEKEPLPLISYYVPDDESNSEPNPLIECACDLEPDTRLQIILFAGGGIILAGSVFFGINYLSKFIT